MSVKQRVESLENRAMPQAIDVYMLIDRNGRVLGSPPEINGMSEPEARLYLDRPGVKPARIMARYVGVDLSGL